MPTIAVGFCLEPRCPQKASYRGRCDTHARQKEQHRYNAATRKWYCTEDWRQLRLRVLADEPVCAHCLRAPSVEVDHKVPHRGDYVVFWDRDNLQGLCKPCHSAKTQLGQ
jgi:5-methylcytosine-specific restriction protein A